MRKKPAADSGRRTAPEREYRPMTFSRDCELSAEERETVEAQRRDLWKHGIRRQPQLDQMAIEFAYTICVLRAASEGT